MVAGDDTTGKGTLAAGNLTLQNDVTISLGVTKNASGAAGTNYGQLSAGALDLSGITHITVSLQNVIGDGSTFDIFANQVWNSVITTTGLANFTSSQFSIDSNNLIGAEGLGGRFSLVQSGNSLNLEYLAIPEPQTWAMLLGGVGLLGFTQRLRRRFQS